MSSATPGWIEVSLGEVCEFKYGRSLPAASRVSGPVGVYGSNGRVGSHTSSLTQGPTIVIGRKGSLGEVNFSEAACWPIDTTYYVDNGATTADLRWLAHRLPALGLTELNKAAAVPGLNRDDAYRMRLLLPPIEEQRRIAELLDRADALRAKRREALARLDDLTQSIFLDMFGDVVGNDRGWPRAAVRDFVSGFESGKNIVADDLEDTRSRYRVLKVSAVTLLHFRSGESKPVPPNYRPPTRHLVRDGDLLFSRANTTELVGATALVTDPPPDLLLPDKLWRFVWHDIPRAEPLFVWHLFRQPRFRREIGRRATGTSGSMQNISQPRVLSIPTGLPPLDLQRSFAQRVTAIGSARDRWKLGLGELDALFGSLQQRAFKGEL